MKLVTYLGGAIVGGAIGWYLGNLLGEAAAFVLSTVGSAFGVYYARRLAKEYLG